MIDGKEIRWAAFASEDPPVRMFALIKSLVSNEAQARALALRDRANLRLNAALFINVHGIRNLSPIVLQEENSLRDRAVNELKSLEPEAEKLLGPREE